MPDHPTCKTCPHWSPRGAGAMGRCGKPGFWMQEPDAAWGYSHGHGGEEPSPISTGPDFGCLHHPELNTDAIEDDANGG